MEKREQFAPDSRILSQIIESNLLASSPSQLASALGYSGRSTINRLRAETAGEEAMLEFCKRLSDTTGLSNDDILLLGRLLSLCDEFEGQMIHEFNGLSDSLKFSISVAFIADDYSLFSNSYKELKLNRWIILKGYEKELFFFMLSLFIFSDKGKSFYGKHSGTGERYRVLLVPVCGLLKGKFPSHTIGNVVSANIYDTPLAKLAYPCFLTAVRLGGIILKGYASNYDEAAFHNAMFKIPGLPDRTFWDENEDRNIVTFLNYSPVNDKGNGLYNYFRYNVLSGKAENPAQLYFYNESEMGFFVKENRRLLFGNYSFDGCKLKLKLFSDIDNSGEFVWNLQDPKSSKTLQEIDKLFTNSFITNVCYESLGMELSCGVTINEVIITRFKILLKTLEGQTLSISRDRYPFLKSATSDMIPLAYRDKDDNKVYIEWEKLGGRISLDEFRCASC